MKNQKMVVLGVLAAALPLLAYCAAFQTGNIGVAVHYEVKSGQATIALVFPGSPAERAGVKTNSIIVSIDGANMLGPVCANSMTLLHGTVGTSVTLELADPAMHQTNKFTIRREDVPMPEILFRDFRGTNAPYRDETNALSPFLIAH